MKMSNVIVPARIRLLDQDLVIQPVPNPRPRLIRPAETEREIGFFELQDFVEGALQDAPTGEPIMPIAETLDTVRFG